MKFFNNNFSQKRMNKGFSLIEMIVASTIFIVAMLIIVGALISLENAARKARVTRIVMGNVDAAIDSISRNIRMGATYHAGCEGDIAQYAFPRNSPSQMNAFGQGGDSCLAFKGQQGDLIVYQLVDGQIQRSSDGGATFLGLTSRDITINTLQFFVSGTDVDQDQPVITMLVRGTGRLSAKISTDFNIQTTIGSRTPNFTP